MHFLFCIFVSDFFMQMKFPSSLRCRKSKGCQYGSVSPSSGWYPQRCCLAWKPQTIYNTTWRWIYVFFLWMVSTLLSHYSTGKHLEEEDEGMQSLFLLKFASQWLSEIRTKMPLQSTKKEYICESFVAFQTAAVVFWVEPESLVYWCETSFCSIFGIM